MKKVLLLPMMLMGVALSFTSCGDNDDPGKDPDVCLLYTSDAADDRDSV